MNATIPQFTKSNDGFKHGLIIAAQPLKPEAGLTDNTLIVATGFGMAVIGITCFVATLWAKK